jgi:hypothetical protein
MHADKPKSKALRGKVLLALVQHFCSLLERQCIIVTQVSFDMSIIQDDMKDVQFLRQNWCQHQPLGCQDHE